MAAPSLPPCLSPGFRCAIDTVPRTFDAAQCNLLVNFAEMVVREIEKHKAAVRGLCPLCCPIHLVLFGLQIRNIWSLFGNHT
jgi:hypothetical protein